jgi:Flp pilus assembly protein TadB
MTALAMLCGAGVGLGLVLIVAGWRGVTGPRLALGQWLALRVQRPVLRLGLAIGAGAIAGLATGWLVGGLAAAMFAAVAPELLGGSRTRQAETDRIEAVAAWVELLRDTLAGAAGIEQAIMASAAAAPAPIRAEVTGLAVRLERERLVPALRAFADELADPTVDVVVGALTLASQRRARRLGELLGTLAQATRDRATMRLRVEASRARLRTSVRVIIGTTVAVMAALVVLNRGYLSPYDSALGQLVLGLIAFLFAAAMWWLARLGRLDDSRRLALTASEGQGRR